MELKNLRIEYMENPLGLDTATPRFSWHLVSTEQGVMQTAYQIVVTKDTQEIWNSGKVEADTSILVEYAGLPLQASTLYQIHVTVWDNQGN